MKVYLKKVLSGLKKQQNSFNLLSWGYGVIMSISFITGVVLSMSGQSEYGNKAFQVFLYAFGIFLVNAGMLAVIATIVGNDNIYKKYDE